MPLMVLLWCVSRCSGVYLSCCSMDKGSDGVSAAAAAGAAYPQPAATAAARAGTVELLISSLAHGILD